MNYTLSVCYQWIAPPRFNSVPCRAQRMSLRQGSGTPQAEQGSCSNFLHVTTSVEQYSHHSCANIQTSSHWRLPEETEMSALRYLYFAGRYHLTYMISTVSEQLPIPFTDQESDYMPPVRAPTNSSEMVII